MRLYPSNLENFITKYNNVPYIPRKITNKEHLKMYHRYFDVVENHSFKVEKIYFVENTEYYDIKLPDKMFGVISFPLTQNIYELIPDKNNIISKNIINENKSYKGYEIRYWFYINRSNLNIKEYDKFISFIDPSSKGCISDNKRYFVGIKNDGFVYVSMEKNSKRSRR